MNKKRKIATSFIKIVSLLLIFSSLTLTLASCGDETNETFVANYLEDHGIPEFSKSKMKGIEIVFRDYYVTDIPDSSELASAVSSLYFEHFSEEIDPTDKEAVTDAVIYCYIAAVGDPYAVYRSAVEHEEYDTDMSGEFYGIGVVVTYSYIEETMTITDVYSAGGAEDAGIQIGDIIIKVNGEAVSDLGYNEAISRVRGELGTKVDITVLRGEEELTFNVTRKKVVEESVSYSMGEDKIAYIKITSFKSNTYNQFVTALNNAVENGAVGIIYDLRANPGGYLSAVANMLAYIAPKGATIASFTNNYADPIIDKTSHSLALPTVVICNENTVSAGELFTAAIRDFDDTFGYFDVTLVGEKTYGKGVMQNTYAFTDDSSITLTVSYYNPPCGENYDGIGITPDVIVSQTENGDAQLDAAYAEIAKLIN